MNHLARRRRVPTVCGLLAVSLLLAGCGASADAAAGPRSAATMSMSSAGNPPPDNALMVCGDDISSKVVQVLKLDRPPMTDSEWADPVYTCTYHLPMGEMVLSVQVAADDASAGDLFDADRTRRAPTQDLLGLGERAFGTAAGVAVVIKDNQVLTVDATALPAVFGDNDQRRTDLANEIASDVLGCWTGDGDE
jgi:hypothetical protein